MLSQKNISPQRKQAGSLVRREVVGAALAAGIALAIGCGGGGSSGRVSAADSFTIVTNMNGPRSGHTATRLTDGRVLIAGGSPRVAPGEITSVLATSELFDPASKSFAQSCVQTATAEIFDPATESFTSPGSMLSARTGFSATFHKTAEFS